MDIRVIPTGLEYDEVITRENPYNVFEYEKSAFELAEELGEGEVVKVYTTHLIHLWNADPDNEDDCDFMGYGVLIHDDWGDPVLA